MAKNKNKGGFGGNNRKLPSKNSNAFVIGNGTSRKNFDLKTIQPYGNIYGLNWFFKKEFIPDVVVASDEPMTREIIKNYPSVVKQRQFYTWFPKPGSGAKKASCPEKFAAGPMATWIACKEHEAHDVFLIGMDFFGFGSKNVDNNGKLNNLYAGEKHYTKQTEADVAPTYRNWQRRFQFTIKSFPNVQFWHVNPFEGNSPEKLRGLPNFHQITWENLVDHLQNKTELKDLLEKTEEDIRLAHEPNKHDLKAILERQIVGQENTIYQDLLTPDQVFEIRKKVNQLSQSKGVGAAVEILGQTISVPYTFAKPGEPLPTDEQVKAMVQIEQQQRTIVSQNYWKRYGIRPIQFPITEEMVQKSKQAKPPKQFATPPPPPPPPMTGVSIPPPPPPVFS